MRAGKLLGRGLAFAAGAGLLLAGGICLGQQVAAAPAPNAVVIDDFAFGPAALSVAAGTRVEWTNRDGEPHTIVSVEKPALFKSAALDTGDKFAFVFDKPGTYRYFCSIHPYMAGTVVVK